MKDVIIIGAGLSGLVCAQQLRQSGVDVTIIEKSAGVGGRMATRRMQGTWVDHGAQYISVRSDGFGRFIHRLQEKGIVQLWTRNFYSLTPEGLKPPIADEMYPRYCCPQGMTAIAKYLATDQKIIHNTRIVAVAVKDQKWHLTTDNEQEIVASALISTVPAPQFLPLFEAVLTPVPSFLKTVRSIKFTPSVTIMAGYAASHTVPKEWQAIQCIDDPVLSWIGLDSSKHPEQSNQPVFVFQSTAEFACQSLEETDLEHMAKPLLIQAGKYLESWLSNPEWWQVHRWRYAFAEEALGVACLTTEIPLPLICAGDWCAGSNVEGAYHSGLAAADSMLELII